jgi:hypothetical protein
VKSVLSEAGIPSATSASLAKARGVVSDAFRAAMLRREDRQSVVECQPRRAAYGRGDFDLL